MYDADDDDDRMYSFLYSALLKRDFFLSQIWHFFLKLNRKYVCMFLRMKTQHIFFIKKAEEINHESAKEKR